MFSLTKRFSGFCEIDKKERGALLANLTEYHFSVNRAKEALALTLSGPGSSGQTKAHPCECSGGQTAFLGHGWNTAHRFLYSNCVTWLVPCPPFTVRLCTLVQMWNFEIPWKSALIWHLFGGGRGDGNNMTSPCSLRNISLEWWKDVSWCLVIIICHTQ